MPAEVEIRVPADKSITHRALMLAALASGRSRIGNALAGADTMATAAALRALKVPVPSLDGPIAIDGRGLHGLEPGGVIDCHNSGTTARLMLGILSGYPFDSALTGDASLRTRPMRRVTTPLELMGARFTELGDADRLPVRVRGGPLHSLHYDSPHASAQVKSAILLAGLTGVADVSITEPRLSRDHTERMLGRLGVRLERRIAVDARPAIRMEATATIDPFEIDVPGDVSSAAFIAAFALIARAGSIRIPDVGLNPTRTGFIDVVRRMGGRIRIENERESCGEPVGDLVAEASELKATRITGAEIPSLVDEVPILAMLAARAEGTTVIEGADELRVKESDRIKALVDGLRSSGVDAHELAAGLEVVGTDAPLKGRVVTHGDHRIAMAFGVLGSAPGGGIVVDDPGAVRVSFPGFWQELRRLEQDVA